MLKFKRFIAASLVLVLAIAVSGCMGKSVATVNGDKISQKEFDKRMEKIKESYKDSGISFDGDQGKMMINALQQQTLETMIQEILVAQDAKEKGVAPTKEEIDKEFKQLKDRFGSDKEYKQALKKYNMDEATLKEMIENNLSYQKLRDKVTTDVKVTDEDIKKYYEENKTTKYKKGESIKVRHILIKFDNKDTPKEQKVNRTEQQALALAKQLLTQINGGADFGKLAKEKSEDPLSAAKDGLLDMTNEGTVTKGQTVTEFETAAFKLGVNQYTKEPVKTVYGYHIIKVEGKYGAKQLTFAEVKDKIKNDLPVIKKDEFFKDYLQKLREKAKIENKLEKEAPPLPSGSSGMPGTTAPKK